MPSLLVIHTLHPPLVRRSDYVMELLLNNKEFSPRCYLTLGRHQIDRISVSDNEVQQVSIARVPSLRFLGERGISFDLLSWLLGHGLARSILRNRRFDICWAGGLAEAQVGCLLKRSGVCTKLVYDDSECFPAVYEGVLRGITSVLEHFVMSNADLVISVSQELASLRTNQGANAVKVIEHGVYYDSFRAAYLQRLKRIDSDFTPRTVVFAGNLTKLLSGPLLAQVISGVSETRPDAKFRLIGTCEPGVMRGFKETAAQLGLCDNIIVEGVVPYTKLPEVFAQCDIGLVNLTSPELPYGTTMKAVLYLAAGLPIIAPARGPISRLFCCGDVGRMVTPSQPELVKAILSALSMSAVEYVKVSTRATETARKSDWKLLGTTYVSLILQSAV